MDNGQIAEKGTHDELMNLKGNYYRLYVSQTEDIDDNNGDDNDEEKVPDSMR